MVFLPVEDASRVDAGQPARAPERLEIPRAERQGQGDSLRRREGEHRLAILVPKTIQHALHRLEL